MSGQARDPSRRALAGRAVWGLADQVFSSLTNFGVNILVARSLGVAAFGAFSLGFGIFVISLNLSRALTSEPLVVRSSDLPRSEWAANTARASGLSFALGVVAGAICVLAAQFMTGDLRAAFIGVGVCMPGLLLQDIWRFAFFASGQGGKALLNDVVWAVVMFPVLVVLLSGDAPSLFLVVLAWGGAATVAGLFGLIQTRVVPSLFGIRSWIKEHRDLTPSYIGEMATGSVFGQLTLFGIGAVSSLAAVGAFRSAYVVFGPLRVLYQSLGLMGVPEAVRFLNESTGRLREFATRTSLVLALIAAGFGVILLLVPAAWGEALLGSVWAEVVPLIVPFTIGIVGFGIMMPVFLGMRALEAAGRSFRTKLTVSTLDAVGSIVGAAFGGAVGAAWGGRPMVLLGSGLWWRKFIGELSRRDSRNAPLESGAGA